MALANVGVLLAQRQAQAVGKGVLLVDWDLEAPGLHRFFRDHLHHNTWTKNEEKQPGLIDLFWEIRSIVLQLPAGQQEADSESELRLRKALDLRRFVIETDINSLHLLKAGRFGADYPTRINTFDWEALYNWAPWVIPWFAGWLAEYYEYVLIDSRTGVTDTSGICTMLLPEKLVVVFTPNLQSTEGALERIERATTYRRRSDDLRPLIVYPLPSRIEPQLQKLRERWRFDASFGYQPRFEELFKRIYGLTECDLTAYFNAVQVPQVPDYAFGEEIAVLVERGADKFSLSSNYNDFVHRLLSTTEPWEIPRAAETQATLRESLHKAYDVSSWQSPAEADIARRVLTRLVRISQDPKEEADTAKRVSFSDLGESVEKVIERLVRAGILRVGETEEERFVELTDPALVEWIQLVDRNKSDRDIRDFLLWRQGLDDTLDQWRKTNKHSDLLLRGVVLEHAQYFASRRADYLNEAEMSFIMESRAAAAADKRRRRRRRWAAAVAALLGLLLIAAFFWVLRSGHSLAQPTIDIKSPIPNESSLIIQSGRPRRTSDRFRSTE